ncbi:MAG: ADP-ribosylglycohydrolase family protein [Phycisphaeraceae bacterium]
MSLPTDYSERVYAGVLGKIIGVYTGRPFESWPHERILQELGEVWYYVHDRLHHRLIVTDDDISGTFAFVRALEEHGVSRELTAEQVGHTWLNHIIEKRTILWWGGLGNSTEHTAYLRLKAGIPAPRSGSSELNSQVVAEQIGAQIFIDGWAMVCPGDPEQAAAFARKAGSVSHDGEAIYGAQVIAAMEAQAFVEPDLPKLIDTAMALIPKDSVIYRLIGELCELREKEDDWYAAFAWLKAHYGYDKFGGNCHVVPNHGIIHLGLLWGEDDFQKSLMITNTCGWDTDCNAANVGCLLGIKNGLAGLTAGADFRTPVADRLYVSTADGGRTITDAVRETYALVNCGRQLAGEKPVLPKDGARFHFELPDSVQGFVVEPAGVGAPPATLENVDGYSEQGQRSLAIHCRQLAPGRSARVATATFIAPDELDGIGYGLQVTPTLVSGQTVEAVVYADDANTHPLRVRLMLRPYDRHDTLTLLHGDTVTLAPGHRQTLRWRIPDTASLPIARVGVEVLDEHGASGTVYLDYLTWTGEPDLTLTPPGDRPTKAWRKAWVDSVTSITQEGTEGLRLVQDEGRGLLSYGTREWTNVQVSAPVTPHMINAAGLAVRVQGMRRYYALLLAAGAVQLVKVRDDEQTVLAEAPLDWQLTHRYELALAAHGCALQATVDGRPLLEAVDHERPLEDGGIALVTEAGRCGFGPVRITPSVEVDVSARLSGAASG